MRLLNGDAKGPQALFVGGCVRNTIIGTQVDDIDIATKLTPPEVTKLLEGAGVKVIPTGIEHGTVTAVIAQRSFEITTLRKDVQTDGRRAVVAFSLDWREDAQRRDFTMNTLLMDGQGNIYDPLGSGFADLQVRRVIFVGDPAARIAEDYLRVLRFFRFHAIYGGTDMDKAALGACRAAADKMPALSRERITQEFLKLLGAADPVPVLKEMFALGVLGLLAPEKENFYDLLAFICARQKERKAGEGALASRLLVLADLQENNLKKFDEFLILSKGLQKEIKTIYAILSDLPVLSDDHAVKIAVYKCGRSAAAQALLIEAAQGHVPGDYMPEALALIGRWDIPVFPVTGDDLIAKGYEPGPALGEKLSLMEEAWIACGFTEAGD